MSSISGIATGSVDQLYQLLATQSSKNASLASSGTGTSAGVSFDMSKPAELFNKLQQLQESDPEQFTEVTAEIASQLKEAAATLSGEEAQRLTELADKFTEASKTGDVASLQPPPPPPPGGAEGAYQANDGSDSSSQSSLTSMLGKRVGDSDNSRAQMDELWSNMLNLVNQALSE